MSATRNPLRSPFSSPLRAPTQRGIGSGSRVLDFASLTAAQLQSRFGWVRSGLGTLTDVAEAVRHGAHNLFGFVSDFTNAAWIKTAGLTFTATTIQDPNSSGFKTVNRFVSSLPPNSTMTFSVRVKKESTRTEFGGVGVLFSGGATRLAYVGIDEVLGTAFQLAGTTVTPTITITENTASDFVVNITCTDNAANTLCQVFLYGTLSINGTTLTNGPGSVRTYTESTLKYGSAPGTLQNTGASALFLMRTPDYTHGVPGLLLEGARTQLLQSGAIGAQLVTQTKTVTAVEHTLSFFGTGTVTLTGAHSAAVVGTGATVLRTFTFTPSAGSLTLTVTGTVTDGQLEAASYPTSRIPNPTTGTMLRVADVAEIGPGAEFDALRPAGQGTIAVEWVDMGSTDGDILSLHSNGTTNELISLYYSGSSILTLCRAGSTSQLAATVGTRIPNALNKAAISWGAGGLSAVLNGGTVQANAAATIPAPTHARIAGTALASAVQGARKLTKITTLATQRTGAALQALTV